MISAMWKAMTAVLHMDPANSDLAAPPSERPNHQKPITIQAHNVNGCRVAGCYLLWHAVSFADTRLVCKVRDVVLV
jgi:hypothetical protein